jgi:uncharacterized protein
MFGKMRFSRWLAGAVMLAAVACAGGAANALTATTQAQSTALNRDQDSSSPRRQVQVAGLFDDLFGRPNSRRYAPEQEQAPQHVDHSHAPPPPKTTDAVPPTTTILVMGDGMADWLGYGLEDAFSDTPEVGIVRKVKQRSGLLRYEYKSDLDWWHVARDILSQEKANYVVMMLGVSDRENIREKDVAKEAEKRKAEKEAKSAADKGAQNKDQAAGSAPKKDQADNSDQLSIMAPESADAKSPNGVIEFRSERWEKIYTRRIDETIAALKSKGVPVFWVGLPSIRGAKSTADAVYLNDLYRARAARAGINYIDVWDGFVDEAGKFSAYGPDYEGQIRRLRTSDGVFFTKYGARKLAHYVEREIRRYMSNHALPMAMPTGPLTPQPGGTAARPVAGPVLPLTAITGNSDQLLGGAGSRTTYGDAIANDVLVKGEPLNAPPGRADDFQWQPGGANAAKPTPAGPTPGSGAVAPAAAPQATIRQVEPTSAAIAAPKPMPQPLPKSAIESGTENHGKSVDAHKSTERTAEEGKLLPPADVGTKPEHRSAPRQHSTFPFGNPLGWLR